MTKSFIHGWQPISNSTVVVLVVLGCVVLDCANSCAAPPVLTNVTPRGWKAGENEVVLQGSGFTEQTRLLLGLPDASVVPKPDVAPAANQMQLLITLPGDVDEGFHPIRVTSEEGASAAQLVMVDTLKNVQESEPNNSLQQGQLVPTPSAVEGRLSGSEADWFAFDGDKGDRIVIEVVGRRLDCNIKPVLRLYDANRVALQDARGDRTIGGDARLFVNLPAKGRYYIELHDLLYRGDNRQYRLLIGQFEVPQVVFPLGGRRGEASAFEMSSRSGKTKMVKISLDVPRGTNRWKLLLPRGERVLPIPMTIAVSDLAETQEKPIATVPAGSDAVPQALPIPGLVNGRLSSEGEIDLYAIKVTPESTLHIFLESHRLGCPLDAVVEVRDEKGKVLLRQDDGPQTADPDFRYVVPKETTSLVLSVEDVHGRGGVKYAYRLGVEPAAEGDFELQLLNPLVNVPAGGSASVRVRAVRREFEGDIRLRVEGKLPKGVEVSGAIIGAGGTDTFLSLIAPADAVIWAGPLRVVGEAGPETAPSLVRVAKLQPQPLHDGLPWLANDFVGSVTRSVPLNVSIVTTDDLLARGTTYTGEVTVKRAQDQTGPVRFNVKISDVPQAGKGRVAAQQNVTIAEGMESGKFTVTVPFNAADQTLSYVASAQLLDAKDKKTVVATAESVSVNRKVVFPFEIDLDPKAELRRGTRHTMAAELTRHGIYKEAVEITVTGLPGTIRTAKLTLPPETSEFEIPFVISPQQAVGELKNVQLTAVDTKERRLVLPPQALSLTVSETQPAAALEIFEDGPGFVDVLTEGAGKAELVSDDVHSGQEAIQVTGKEKSRAVLPGLSIPIVEKPESGQYRFLRFAWKKKGGTQIGLQLAAGNRFGATSPNKTDYRYLAGKGEPMAMLVSPEVPGDWVVVTRDLFADHGAFTLSGLSMIAGDGEAALFDHLWLAREEQDFPDPKSK